MDNDGLVFDVEDFVVRLVPKDGDAIEIPVDSRGNAWVISVVRFLIDQSVPAERVMAAGFAHFRPLDPGDGEDAFRRNRRIEFRLTQK